MARPRALPKTAIFSINDRGELKEVPKKMVPKLEYLRQQGFRVPQIGIYDLRATEEKPATPVIHRRRTRKPKPDGKKNLPTTVELPNWCPECYRQVEEDEIYSDDVGHRIHKVCDVVLTQKPRE